MTALSERQTAAWQWYHKRKDITALRAGEYTRLVNTVDTANSNLLDGNVPKIFLLAGFHALNGTPEAFLRFARKIHPNSNDKHVFLDTDIQDMRKVPNEASVHRVTSRLEKLSFSDSTLDFILVDYTTDFMSDEQARAFAERASTQLTIDGVLLVAKKFLEIAKIFPRKYPESPTYFPRDVRTFLNLMKVLKPVAFTVEPYIDFATYIVFARQDSPFEAKVPDGKILAEQTEDPPWRK